MANQIEISINFHKSNYKNDINAIERLLYPIFSKKSEEDVLYWKKIRSLFLAAMKNAELTSFQRNIFWLFINRVMTKNIKKGNPLREVENTLRKFVRRFSNSGKDTKSLSVQRAKMNFENMKSYIIGEKILDLGAGDGLLALEIKKFSKEVLLIDILDYNQTDLPIILYNPEGKLPLADNEVDTTILYTVLHHSSDPMHLIEEAMRVTKHRLIIKEAYIENEINRMTNSFFDWFYNRVVGDEDINVPLNFLKVSGWQKIIESYGFDIIETKYMGIDEPLVPEYHIFIIADKKQ
jgi:ubiquinone/menaquinone biosynthesis C-methylase UbiE